MNKDKLVVGITGTLLSGKGTIVEILKSKGFIHESVRELIREELVRHNLEPTRPNMQDMGNNMRKKHGSYFWIQKALEKHSSDTTPLIIESLRNPIEIEYLKKHSKFFLIGVDAPFEVRWQRVKKRNVDADMKDYDNFVHDDARDKGLNEPINGQQVGMCLVHADFLINNDEEFTKLEDSKLYSQVIEICDEIMKK